MVTPSSPIPFVDTARAALREATSWDELRGHLERVGLAMKRLDAGLVVHKAIDDRGRWIPSWLIDSEAPMQALEMRFGEAYSEWRTRTMRASALDVLRSSVSWDEAEASLASVGLCFESGDRGGLRLSDGRTSFTAGNLHASVSRRKLEERFGETWREFCARSAR